MSARVKIDLLSQAVKQMVRKVMPNMESVDNQSFSDSKITFLDDSGALRLTVACLFLSFDSKKTSTD